MFGASATNNRGGVNSSPWLVFLTPPRCSFASLRIIDPPPQGEGEGRGHTLAFSRFLRTRSLGAVRPKFRKGPRGRSERRAPNGASAQKNVFISGSRRAKRPDLPRTVFCGQHAPGIARCLPQPSTALTCRFSRQRAGSIRKAPLTAPPPVCERELEPPPNPHWRVPFGPPAQGHRDIATRHRGSVSLRSPTPGSQGLARPSGDRVCPT